MRKKDKTGTSNYYSIKIQRRNKMSEKVIRAYGKDFPIGDILFDKKENVVYFRINAGFFGLQKVILVQNNEGTYNMMKTYMGKDGQPGVVNIGKTFPVTNKQGETVEGITQGTLAMGVKYDKDLKKEISDNRNALYFTTHRLREQRTITDTLVQVGYIRGRFGIEIDEQGGSQEEMPSEPKTPPTNAPGSDEVPF